jgi:glycosyltransferase involved in cell wall biosynthesis
MAENTKNRKKIGLLFFYSDNWIGGSYYIINLVQALNQLEDNKKPHLVIFIDTKEEFDKLVEATNYPYLSYKIVKNAHNFEEFSALQNFLNKVYYKFFKKFYFDNKLNPNEVSVCFPNPTSHFFEDLKKNQRLFWIPDFQEVHLPQFFEKEALEFRYRQHENVATQEEHIIFSSQDAKKDFYSLFPNSSIQSNVLNFAVTHPKYEHLSINELVEKYKLPQNYFFAPNQFWKHKNQTVILEAVKVAKQNGVSITVAFSGKMHDYRNTDYTESLINFVKENQLEENIFFLGFIDRSEQLKLMKEAIAIIQPSLFEGWSTVVEDTKAMNQYIILSDLPVHKEQMKTNVSFFSSQNPNELSELLQKYATEKPSIEKQNYQSKVIEFGENFLQLIDEMN